MLRDCMIGDKNYCKSCQHIVCDRVGTTCVQINREHIRKRQPPKETVGQTVREKIGVDLSSSPSSLKVLGRC